MVQKSLTQEVAEFVTSTDYASLPLAVRHRAKQAVIDSLGVTLAGSRTRESEVIRRYLQGLSSSGNATVVGTSLSLPSPFAALANGVSGHALDYDDT